MAHNSRRNQADCDAESNSSSEWILQLTGSARRAKLNKQTPPRGNSSGGGREPLATETNKRTPGSHLAESRLQRAASGSEQLAKASKQCSSARDGHSAPSNINITFTLAQIQTDRYLLVRNQSVATDRSDSDCVVALAFAVQLSLLG